MKGSGKKRVQRSWLPKSPINTDQDFTRLEFSFADVYTMAASLHQMFAADTHKTVCLATENKAVIAAALLAALAGETTLLLPPALSKRTLARMQHATGFSAAVTETTTDIIPGRAAVLWPESTSARLPSQNFSYDKELLRLFTGGSTGKPAIWSKTGSNLFSEAVFLAEFFGITETDCIVATISPCHIYGLLFSVLIPLVSSATVLAGTPSFPAEIAEAVQENKATVLAAVPAHYRALRHQQTTSGSLRFAVSSAGMLDPEDNAFFCSHNKSSVIEVYGSTETGGIATRNRAVGETLFTPFSTVDWKIIGERLAVRSSYISSQALLDKEGFFITGDRVEAGEGNTFILKGRVDGITKVGGKRVDLEEIREAIKQQPQVQDCFVCTQPDPRGRENQICALVQMSVFNKEEIMNGLQSVLEPYAFPRILRGTQKIPLTAAGKYDLAAIRLLLNP